MESGIVNHALDELGIHFNDKLLDSDGEELSLLQRLEETMELELGLGVTRFLVVDELQTRGGL